MSNYLFENPYFTIIGFGIGWKKFKFDIKKIEWFKEIVEF